MVFLSVSGGFWVVDSGCCDVECAGGFLCVLVGWFFDGGFDYAQGGFALEFDDGFCPELQRAGGDGGDGYGGFVEGAFDLAGDYDGEVLDFGGLGKLGELAVEFSAEVEGSGFGWCGLGDFCAVEAGEGVYDD